MKHLPKIALLLIIVACGTGCTTGYWVDRGRDAADVFTVTGGYGAGLKAQGGPVHAGLYGGFGSKGLRGGRTLDKVLRNQPLADLNKNLVPNSQDYTVLLWGEEKLDDSRLHYRGKNFHSLPFFPFLQYSNSLPHYTQCDITIGLGFSARLGFNPGELIDLLLGFTGIDIYSDDLERRKEQKIEQADAGSVEPNP